MSLKDTRQYVDGMLAQWERPLLVQNVEDMPHTPNNSDKPRSCFISSTSQTFVWEPIEQTWLLFAQPEITSVGDTAVTSLNRFLLFSGYYGDIGWQGFIGSYDTIKELKCHVPYDSDRGNGWYQIVDLQEKKIIEEGKVTFDPFIGWTKLLPYGENTA